jgi:DNA-binding CsgD family transcriptional regulator
MSTDPQTASRYVIQTPLNCTHLGWLCRTVFGVRQDRPSPVVEEEYVPVIAQAVDAALVTLTPREEIVMRMRLGLNPQEQDYSWQRIADHLGVSRYKIRKVEAKALRKLRHPSRSRLLHDFWTSQQEGQSERWLVQRSSPDRRIELVPVIETVKRLEPSLIAHLQKNHDDLRKIRPDVFEHLIAEFLASQGFDDVRLVGRNRRTSADIYAAIFIPKVDIPIKFFVEVKRWKDVVGIEIINQVLGAYLGERERFGWHAAMIVTVGGFADMEKWTREEMELKGVVLKDRNDLLRYLENYKQNENGLWLPNPRTDLLD